MIQFVLCVLIFGGSEDFSFFTFCAFWISLAKNYIDAIGIGVAVIVTKLEERYVLLGGKLSKLGEIEGRAIGFYFGIQVLTQTLCSWVGESFVFIGMRVEFVYLFMMTSPALMFFYTLLVFKEKRVKNF